LKVRYF